MGDNLSYFEGLGWELTTDLPVPRKVEYFDKDARKFYTREEVMNKRLRRDVEFFKIFKVNKE